MRQVQGRGALAAFNLVPCMTETAKPGTRERVFTGIGLTTLAYFLFSCQDAAIKLLVETIDVWQIMFFRSVVVLTGCVLFSGPGVIVQSVRSPIVGAMVARSVLILSAWLSFYGAARYLQLAELTTIYFTAPVIVTVLSIVVLGEKVPALRWVAVLTGFVGVFVACDPGATGLSWPIVMVLAAAFLWAMSVVLIRKLALRERTIIQIVLNNVFFLAAAAVPMIVTWHTPSATELTLMVSVGLVGGLAQFGMFEGMKHAEASVLAGFEYTALIWAFLFGYMIWGDLPRPAVFFGAALIFGAGLLMVVGERARLRRV